MKVLRLSQLLAIVEGAKAASYKLISDAHKVIQKNELFSGMVRTYRPLTEDGDTYPTEMQVVQQSVWGILETWRAGVQEFWSAMICRDLANMEAKADIVMDDGTVLIPDVPVTSLLSLHKQLTDLKTYIAKLPVLAANERWTFDAANVGLYASESQSSNRTQKELKAMVLYDATDRHPAQVDKFTIDVVVGRWSKIMYSGAIPQDVQRLMLLRVRRLVEAVEMARAQANTMSTEYEDDMAAPLLNYIFQGTSPLDE